MNTKKCCKCHEVNFENKLICLTCWRIYNEEDLVNRLHTPENDLSFMVENDACPNCPDQQSMCEYLTENDIGKNTSEIINNHK